MSVSPAGAAPARHKTATRPSKRETESHSSSAPAVTETAHATAESVTAYSPAHQEIAALAYGYWLNRGCQDGFAEEDWLRAERELQRGTIS